jgi:hypothetical protein
MRWTTGAASGSTSSLCDLPGGGLGGVRVWTVIDEHVPVRGPATQEPVGALRHVRHRDLHAQLNARPFGLAHAAEQHHHHVVGLRAGVDDTADLGHPQLHPEMSQDRESESELVPVEGPLRFTDHDGIEHSVGAGDAGQQPCGFWSSLPWQRSGQPDVEELLDDDAVHRCNEASRSPQLPAPAGFGVLLVLGRDPPVESEPHPATA